VSDYGRLLPFVTFCDFPALATCHAELDGRFGYSGRVESTYQEPVVLSHNRDDKLSNLYIVGGRIQELAFPACLAGVPASEIGPGYSNGTTH
jgi:hypothetical protein